LQQKQMKLNAECEDIKVVRTPNINKYVDISSIISASLFS
jgi:hypothetical protein